MDWTIRQLKPRQDGVRNISVPADKSITHRAVMLSAITKGATEIENYLPAEDCMNTLRAFEEMGVKIEKLSDKVLKITGVGLRGLKKPKGPIYAGNSGTTVRLLSGILAGQDFKIEITGDDSLSKRPMKRIIEPLRQMGVEIFAKDDNYLPLIIKGTPDLKPLQEYKNTIASAQVKSCVLLAGLYANGKTVWTEPVISRDHTERMLMKFGVDVEVGSGLYSLTGPVKELASPGKITVPADISSAAFFIAAGALLSGLKITLNNVGINPTRNGILTVLNKINMNANIFIDNHLEDKDEPTADITVKTSKLNRTTITSAMIPSLIDEIPVIALLATQAKGITEITGAGELRVKESDRLKTIVTQLKKMKADIDETKDGMIIRGPVQLKGAVLDSFGDHRVAMTFAVAGLIAEGRTTIRNVDCVNTSFPDFKDKLISLGAEII